MNTCSSLSVLLEDLLSSDNAVREAGERTVQLRAGHIGFVSSLIVFACFGTEAVEAGGETDSTTCDEDGVSVLNLPDILGSGNAFEVPDEKECLAVAPATHLRSLAAVLAKKFIREQWETIWEDEKATIKTLLLQHLIRPPAVIRGPLHVIVADIAAMYAERGHDAGWPELFPTLRYLLNQCRERHATRGILALLHLLMCMAEAASSKVALSVRLLGEETGVQDALHHLALGMPQFDFNKQKEEVTIPAESRREALKVYRLCLQCVLQQGSSDDVELLILPRLQQWEHVCIGLINDLVAAPIDLDAVKSAVEVLKCLSTFLRARLPGLEKALIRPLKCCLEGCLEVLDAYYPFYENMVINDTDNNAAVEEAVDGGPLGLFIEICNTFIECTAFHRLRAAVVHGRVRDILGAVVKFLQLTETQCGTWIADGNEFLAHEEESFLEPSARVAGQELLEALLQHEREPTIEGVIESIVVLFNLSDERRQASEAMALNGVAPWTWWKPLELAFWLAGWIITASDGVLGAPQELYGRLEIDTSILRIGHAFGQATSPPVLRARALLTAARLRHLITAKYPNDISSLLLISAQAMGEEETIPVKLAACRAFASFLADVKEGVVASQNVLGRIENLLVNATEETLRLCLDVLARVVDEAPNAAETVKDSLSNYVIEAWRRSSNDPLVNIYFQDFLSAACQSNGGLRTALQDRLLPSLMKTIRLATREPVDSHDLTTAIDLYATFVRSTGTPLPPVLWEGFPYVLAILSQTEDASVVETGCEALALLIIAAPEEIRKQNQVIDILSVAQKLLSPELDDHAALMAGPLLQIFIRHFGPTLSPGVIHEAFSAVLRRMLTAQLPALQQSLLTVLCRFICESPNPMSEVLESITLPWQEQSVTGLTILITSALDALPSRGGLQNNPYVRNVVYSALVLILRNRYTTLRGAPDMIRNILQALIRGLAKATRSGHKRVSADDVILPSAVTTPPPTMSEDLPSERGGLEAGLPSFIEDQDVSIMSAGTLLQGSQIETRSCIDESPMPADDDGSKDTWSQFDIIDVFAESARSSSTSSDADERDVLRQVAGYRSIFVEEEEHDRMARLNLRMLLEKELATLWNDAATHEEMFQNLSPPVLALWQQCLHLMDSRNHSNTKAAAHPPSSSSKDTEECNGAMSSVVTQNDCNPS